MNIIQHRSEAKHQNADVLSPVHLGKCGWTECLDCKKGCDSFADEDDSLLTQHNEELIIKPASNEPQTVVTTRQDGSNAHLVLSVGAVQADPAPSRHSGRLAAAVKAAAQKLQPPLKLDTINQEPEIVRGKTAYALRQLTCDVTCQGHKEEVR